MEVPNKYVSKTGKLLPIIFKLIAPVLIVLIFSPSVKGQLWVIDPLEAIFPDSNKVINFDNQWQGDYPFGTVADVHVLTQIPVGETFSLSASIEDNEVLGVEVWSKLIDIPVEQNTGIDSRTEKYINEINPYVIRRAPFRIFEVIQPLSQKTLISTTKYSGFRLSIPPAILKVPGNYKIKIHVKSQNIYAEGIFLINVHPVTLPGLSESKFFYTNWFNLAKMEEAHHLERWSESWFKMLDKYAQIMAYGRQNSITIPNELIELINDEIILKDSMMARFIDIFRNYGFTYFESPHLMNRGEGDDWGDPELKVALTKRRYYEENGKEDIRNLATLIKDFAEKHDLTNNWLQHISDEPTSVNARCYKDVANQVRAIFPEVKIMEATNDKDSIVGAVDIWCPLINDFQENETFFRERELLGEKVLVYTCLIPGGKWLNRTLDMEKIRQVYFGWGAAFYNTGGYLHWGLNQYYADPFEQSVVKHPSPVAGPTNYLPAGDTHIIYPGESGPLSSIRFEAHRIGCEDYELLQLLKKKNNNLFDTYISNLFRTYTDYNLDLKDYRKTKRKLLESLN